MPYLSSLAKIARATGYPVTEVSGWSTRGHGPQPEVQGFVCHHTAGPSAGGDYPSLRVVRDGRSDLPGPLSHFGLGRSGRIYVIAAGRCWHNAPSTSPYHENSSSLGIEAENDGKQPWPAVQLDAYRKLCAELCKAFSLPASRVRGHKEVNIHKPDPHSINMNDFRADVARLIEGDDMPLSTADLEAIRKIVWEKDAAKAPTGAPDAATNKTYQYVNVMRETYTLAAKILPLVTKIASQTPDIDEAVLAQALLVALTPDKIAAAVVDALPPELAAQVVAEIGDRLATPGVTMG